MVQREAGAYKPMTVVTSVSQSLISYLTFISGRNSNSCGNNVLHVIESDIKVQRILTVRGCIISCITTTVLQILINKALKTYCKMTLVVTLGLLLSWYSSYLFG